MFFQFRLFDILFMIGLGWGITGLIHIVVNAKKQKNYSITKQFFIQICFIISLLDHLIKPPLIKNSYLFIILFTTRNIGYLTGPAIWFYTRSLIKNKTYSLWKDLLHFLPFLFWMCWIFVFPGSLLPFADKTNSFPGPHGSLLPLIRDEIVLILTIGYCIVSLHGLFKYKRTVQEYYSRKSIYYNLNWLQILLFAIIAMSFTGFILYLIQTPPPPLSELSPDARPLFDAHLLNPLSSMLFLLYFSIFSPKQNIPDITKTKIQPAKYEKSGLDIDKTESLYKKLIEYMMKNKPYLNGDLTLSQLAEELSVSKHHLSQTINIKIGKPFYTFINQYRLDEFINAINENRYPSYTLRAIANECGFKSTGFYSLFKQTIGCTPSEYMRKARSTFREK